MRTQTLTVSNLRGSWWTCFLTSVYFLEALSFFDKKQIQRNARSMTSTRAIVDIAPINTPLVKWADRLTGTAKTPQRDISIWTIFHPIIIQKIQLTCSFITFSMGQHCRESQWGPTWLVHLLTTQIQISNKTVQKGRQFKQLNTKWSLTQCTRYSIIP